MPENDEEAKAFLAAQAEEYGQYVATQVITHDGVRAYNPGDAVPASNVKRHGYLKQGLVEKTDSAKKG